MKSIFNILHKNFQEDQLISRRFPGVVDTLQNDAAAEVKALMIPVLVFTIQNGLWFRLPSLLEIVGRASTVHKVPSQNLMVAGVKHCIHYNRWLLKKESFGTAVRFSTVVRRLLLRQQMIDPQADL